jgi:hypothetical protein
MKFLNSAVVTNTGTVTASSVIATSSIVLSSTNNYTINWTNPGAARTINVVDPTATSQLMLGVITSPSSGQVLSYDGTKWVNSAASTTTAIGSTVTSGTVGSILFVGTGPVLAQDNANFFWDDTNNRLGVGTNSPSVALHVKTPATINSIILLDANSDNNAAVGLRSSASDSTRWNIVKQNSTYTTAHALTIDYAGGSPLATLTTAGKFGLGVTTPLATLDVQGGVRYKRNPQTTSYTITVSDYLIAVTDTTAARTITLPSAASTPAGQMFVVSDESGGAATNNITVTRAGTDTIEGVTTKVINTNYGSIRLYSDGSTKWFTTAQDSDTIGELISGATVGSVFFAGTGSTLAQDNANFFYDSTNHRLGVGGTTTAATLSVGPLATTGDKIRLWGGTDTLATRYGLAVQPGTWVAYTDGTSGAFSFRRATTSTDPSTGTEVFGVTAAGLATASGGFNTPGSFRTTAFGQFVGVLSAQRFVFNNTGIVAFSGGVTNTALAIQGLASQTGPLLDFQDSSSASLAKFGAQGWLGLSIGAQAPQCSLDVGGGVAYRRTSTATNYTIKITDSLIGVTDTTAARTLSLPAANTFVAGQFVTVCDESGGAATNNITINRAGSDTIQGGVSFILNRNYQTVTLYSNGSNAWYTNQNSGVQGLVGVQGYQGYQGINGTQGNQGFQGSNAQVAVYSTTFTSASLSAGLLTVTHNLNVSIVSVVVYNSSSQLVIPNQVTLTSNNVCTIDLNGNSVSGTWKVVVLSGGSVTGAIGGGLSGGVQNEILYVDNNGNLAQSPGLYFQDSTTQLGVGDSSLLGIATFTGNVPSGDTSPLVLYNKGGGAGASVSMDFYSTSAHSNIPTSKVRMIDDGNFSNHIEFWTKAPGASTNAITPRGKLSSLGSWVLNDGTLALSATDGFTYLPGCQGVPTGVPTTWAGVPIVYNTTGSTLYAYNSGWKAIGTQGTVGPQGTQGVNGSNGAQGVQGFNGVNGTQGVQGFNGVNGTQGVQGFNGVNGTQGVQGFNGVNGTQGSQGAGTQGVQGNDGPQGLAQDVLVFVLGSGIPATTGVDKTNHIYAVSTGSISKAFISAKTAPVGSALIVDIKKNGTSIWNVTPANRLQLASGATTGTQTSFDATTVTSGDVFSIDVVQVGSTTAGQDITVQLLLGVASVPGVQGFQGSLGNQGFQGASATSSAGTPLFKTANYTLGGTDTLILANPTTAGFTLTLATAAGKAGQVVVIKKTDTGTNVVTIACNGVETIDGSTIYRLEYAYEFVSLLSDGTNWLVISQ